ncbi:ribonuclease H-like domain-containing protein [Tanacetum coccineum]
MLVKYDCHINVEWCNQGSLVKYPFSYITKGSDRSTVVIELDNNNSQTTYQSLLNNDNEIEEFVNCRYVSACEAYNDDPEVISERISSSKTKFIEWMVANQKYPEGRCLTYVDYPTMFTWHDDIKAWKPQKSSDDTEWIDTIHGGSQWQRGLQLIDLFVSILLFYDVADIGQFFRSSLPYLAPVVIDRLILNMAGNRFIAAERMYNIDTERKLFTELYFGLNCQQTDVFNSIMRCVEALNGCLSVALSGIASLLLPGGRTSYSRFRISIDLDKDSCCAIDVTSDLAELIKDHVRGGHNKVFGGKVVVLGGDFRQIHPVISNGTRFDIKKPIPTIYARTTTNPDGYMLNLTIPGPVTTEEKDAKTLFAAIQTRFGDNDAIKKTQKTLLKQITNEVNTTNVQVSTANYTISTGSTLNSTANLSDAIVYASYPNNHYGSLHLFRKDPITIHEDDLEEMDLKWQLALLSMRARRYYQRTRKKITINGSDTAGYDKSKVEYFNCHKMRHIARECRGPRNQESRARNQDSSRRTVNVEETASKVMVAIDGAGFNWSYMADEEVLTNLALMDFSDSEPEFEGFLNLEDNKSVCKNSANEIKKTTDAPIIEYWVSDCDEDDTEVMVLKSDNVQHKPEPANQPKKMVQKPVLNNVKKRTGQREVRPVWNNAMRVNHQNFSNSRRNFVPTAVLTKSGIVPISAARPINTVAPKSFGNRVTSAVGEQGINAVKSSTCWVWRPKIKADSSLELKGYLINNGYADLVKMLYSWR